MKLEDVKELIPLNGNVFLTLTDETIEATNDTMAIGDNAYLSKCPMARVDYTPANCIVDNGDYVLYRKLSEVAEFRLNGVEYKVVKQENLISKCIQK